MYNYVFNLLFCLLIFSSCSGAVGEKHSKSLTNQELNITTGAEQLTQYYPKLKGKKVGLVVNQTSTIGKTHLVDTLLKVGITIEKIFAPEHGFRGDHSAGATVSNSRDVKTGIEITSLYGSNKKPKPEQIKGWDIVVFDIQDVGVRFYTYISTMHYVMESCAEQNIPVLILDRPNPNAYLIDGPILDPKFKSFIGMHPIPLSHGLTVGELAQMINGEKWLTNGIQCEIEIIKCKNWTHDSMYQLPIPPSPNLPTQTSIYLYPTLGLFEGTNVSVGRGTSRPFEILGRPGLEKDSFNFTPIVIPGVADNPKYKDQMCNGIDLKRFCYDYLIGYNKLYLPWLFLFYETNTASDGDFFRSSFDKLAGTDQLRKQIIAGKTPEEIYESWEVDLLAYRKMRNKYLLYP